MVVHTLGDSLANGPDGDNGVLTEAAKCLGHDLRRVVSMWESPISCRTDLSLLTLACRKKESQWGS